MSDKSLLRKTLRAGYAEQQFALHDGEIINYAESADASKPPLLLIHGQTGAWQDYCTVLPALAHDYHVIAVDCHGHGKSTHNPAKYTAKAIAADLAELVKARLGKPVIISGHSSGGLIAAFFAATYPELTAAALLEDPPFFSTEKGERWESSFAYVDTYRTIHNFLSQSAEKDWVLYYLEHAYWGNFVGEKGISKMVSYGTKYRAKHPGKPLHYFFLPNSINHMFAYMDSYDLQFGESFYNLAWFEGYDQSEVLSKLTCPAVLIHTKWSVDENGILLAAMSGEDAEKANALMKNSEIFDIESGHDSHAEKPAEFIKAMAVLKAKMTA